MTVGRVGIFGGGQLGRLLCLAAPALQLRTVVLAAEESEPAAQVADEVVLGDYQDAIAAAQLAERADLVTFEIETVGAAALMALEQSGTPCFPRTATLRLIQNKLLQKQHFHDHDIPTAPFLPLPEARTTDFARIAGRLGVPFVQKAQLGGYDGRGVKVVKDAAELESTMGPSLVEAFVDRAAELSVVLARTAAGEVAAYPPVAMVFHEEHNILNYTLAPAELPDAVGRTAQALARRTVDSLDGVGVFAVELFLTGAGELLVNEVSPRVHNSGHWTLDGCNVSQFEQHLRAVAGFPLVPVECHQFVATKNLLGSGTTSGPSRVEGLEAFRDAQDVFVHLYGKPLCYPQRKMGHVTAVGPSAADAVHRVEEAARRIRIVGGRDAA